MGNQHYTTTGKQCAPWWAGGFTHEQSDELEWSELYLYLIVFLLGGPQRAITPKRAESAKDGGRANQTLSTLELGIEFR